MICRRCNEPHPALNGMTPWDYYHACANLGKYEEPDRCTYECACSWLDEQVAA